ncbi:MlaD family protein [Flavobacterium sp. NRK F10]|uniref:MlaD family protein n=1 Tax=Flavobacterium sp. NRK F10 TaxID=2954931 RepID=UPI002091D099|nr:MlaD family protein [Flavobacterium sp. NRK F10]MCO6173943.1 MlaD family protein [Flavobacterium sp. NRK F10]
MTKTSSENIRLGIFVIIGSLFLLLAIYFIGNYKGIIGKTFTINAVFTNVNGLQKGNNVRFSGVDIGTVGDIEMESDTTVRVHMVIDEKMMKHIKKDAIATIGSDGLVGNMIVNIIPGRNSQEYVQNGDQIISYTRIGTEEMLNTLNVTNENAALLTADLLKVVRSLTQGKGTFGRLLNDTLMADDLQVAIRNLKHTSSRADKTVLALENMVERISFEESVAGVLLTDTVSGNKMRHLITDLEASGKEISQMTKDLNDFVALLNERKGTVNYLVQDTALVKQLENIVKNVDEGTGRFNENMEALKHNFLFRGYFKKKEKEEKKEKTK